MVFVALERNPHFSSPVKDSQFVESNIVDYARGHPSIPPGGFDYVIAQNVLTAPTQIQQDLTQNTRALNKVIKMGGLVIIEEIHTPPGESLKRRIEESLGNAGFVVWSSTDRSSAIDSRFWVTDAIHFEAVKIRQASD